jgi:hypothetical protein
MNKPLAFAAIAALTATTALAQSPRGKAELTLGGKTVAVDYGRPSLQGRDMLGKATVGFSWRLGADAATSLTTEGDLSFGAAAVPAGSYTLSATKLAEDAWQLVVSDGAKNKVAEIPLELSKIPESVEMFTIELSKKEGAGLLQMSWGTARLSTGFTGK